MRHQSIGGNCDEPCFEPPPLLSARPERRLTARAMLDATRAGRGEGAAATFRTNAVRLTRTPDGVAVRAAGAAVAAGFDLVPGPLCGPPDSLAETLKAAFAVPANAPLPFEAVVATPRAASVLLRGILLPLAGGDADAVLSWKEVLGSDAEARLRAELLVALRSRAPCNVRGDAFA